jgi:excisionase family DNA binding protein
MPTTAEAADRLGIKPRSVVAFIKREILKAEKRGRDYWIEDSEVERYSQERQPQHRPRKERTMKAIEIELEKGTYYIPLQTYDHNKVLIPMDNGQRVLSPADIRTNWDAWVSDLVPWSKLLTREELDAQHPGIEIDEDD